MAKSNRASNVVPLFAPALSRCGNKIDRDTINALEVLLEGARNGEVIGIAFACALPGMRYVTDVTGFLYDHPSFARGAIDYLGDEIAGVVHARDPQGIR